MKPFLHLAVRDLDAAADDEHRAILRSAGLAPEQLVLVRVDAGPLPDLDPDLWSGAFIGGSAFNVSDAVKSELQLRAEVDLGRVVDLAVAGRLPLLGLCYGFGVMVRHLGGVMDGRFREETSAVDVELTPSGRADPIFRSLPERFAVCTGHKEACSEAPPGAIVLAANAACPVQAFRVGEMAYATQFHAELDPDAIIDRMALYRDSGYFPAHEFDAVAARVRAGGVQEWPARIVRGFAERFAG
ncbi:GMP synthase [glutamine-hydrolyzing] [Pseudoclavibacter triregionum]|nr:GMP synthase [glutamine-hydrolyzing] [Pseudoclavibacter triregionum]